MQTHIASVRSRRIAWDVREVVQHGLNADRVELALDAEWQECDRVVAVLAKTGAQAFRVDAGDGFFIPSALMEETGPLRMCLLGYKGDSVRIVTAKETAPLVVVESGEVAGMDPAPEQPDLWAQLMEEVRKATDGAKTAAQSATRAEADLRAAAERGDFDGEDGKTPVRGVDYWTAEDRKPIEDATLAATTAAGRADAAAEKASVGEASRVAAESERANTETARAKAEQAREIAETGRVEAEATRAAHESKRTESFNTNLVSWNSKVDSACKKATDTASKAAQDAKTATEAAIAKTEEATQAAVAKADKATASATTAANKAEAAVSKLPLPLGNTLKGEKESTMVNVHDAFPAPLVETKVMGQSNQLTTTGKNLLGGERYVSGYNIRGFKNILKPNTQYTYSCSGITDGNAAFRLLAFNAQQSKEISLTVGYIKNDSETFTTPENIGEFEELYLGGNYNEAGKNCINSHFQIEEGAKATAYEPFTGGKPSPSPDYPQEITNLNKSEIVTVGKNLFSAQIDISSGNTNEPIYLSKGTYTISVKNEVEWWKKTANDNRVYIHTFKENEFLTGVAFQNLVVGQRSYGTFNVNKNCEARLFTYGSWDNNAVTEIQLEAASTATTYEPHQSKSTPINLKGNELCSLPNGVKDEVVIDSEGNVSLIKRVTKIQSDKLAELVYDVHPADVNGNLPYIVANFNDDNDFRTYEVRCNVRLTGNLKKDKSVYATGNALVVVDTRFTDVETAKQILKSENGIYYYEATPQTIPLGKVELPALPEATSNVWNNGNIPANVYINYLKDVNIAFADLESKLTQAVVAAVSNI